MSFYPLKGFPHSQDVIPFKLGPREPLKPPGVVPQQHGQDLIRWPLAPRKQALHLLQKRRLLRLPRPPLCRQVLCKLIMANVGGKLKIRFMCSVQLAEVNGFFPTELVTPVSLPARVLIHASTPMNTILR